MDIKKINNKGIFDTSNNRGNSFVTSHRNLSSFGLTSPLSTVQWISIVEHREIAPLKKQCHEIVHISLFIYTRTIGTQCLKVYKCRSENLSTCLR